MKQILLMLLIVLATGAMAQNRICHPDTISQQGSLINKIISESESGVTIRQKQTDKTYVTNRLCPQSYADIESLNGLIRNEEVNELLECDNNALKVAGFIIYSKRHPKAEVISKLKILMNGWNGFMSNGCYDAIQTLTIQRYLFNLLVEKNQFYQPQFTLTKKEKDELEQYVETYERNYWNK